MNVMRSTARGHEYFYFRQNRDGKKLLRRLTATTRADAEMEAGQILDRLRRRSKIQERRAERRLLDDIRAHMPQLHKGARTRARDGGFEFEITVAYLDAMLLAQDFRCALTGIPFHMRSAESYTASRDPWRPSIDRIDASKGYVPGNCRLVCTAVNTALNEWGDDVFLIVARAASERNAAKITKLMRTSFADRFFL